MATARSTHHINERLVIAALLEAAIYATVWLWNEYVAFYLTIILPLLFFLLLIFAAVADWIEPSRVPRWYYILMFISIVIPLIIGTVFYLIYGGRFDFLQN